MVDCAKRATRDGRIMSWATLEMEGTWSVQELGGVEEVVSVLDLERKWHL